MPLSSNIHSYTDIAAVLQTALPSGRATYRLATEGKAIHWMMRANKYRLLLQRQEAITAGIKGYQPPTPYDQMKLTRKGAAVEIDFNPQPVGELSLPNGKVVKPTLVEERPAPAPKKEVPKPFSPRTAPSTDDWSEIAAQLAAEHGDED